MKKAMKDLAPIVIPHGPPVESTAEYFKSKMETASTTRKYPVWDVARPTPQVLMEQARRDLMEADEKLSSKREEEKANRVIMDAKWQELREKELLLKESFISFNKFIRENQEKRDRAERKMEEDNQVLIRKTRETEAMRKRVAEMEEVKRLMEQQVRDYTIYEDYLMSVVQNYPEFKQPLDVLNRYEALAAAKNTLADRQERDLEMLEEARQEIAALTEEKKLFIMGLNNTLAELRWRYDKVKNRVIEWEMALNRLKEAAAARHVELCQVRAAIWSLYVKICTQKGMTIDVKETDFEQQLVVIMRALLELRKIYKIAERRSKEKCVLFASNVILLCGQLDLLCCSLRNSRYTALLRSGVQHRALVDQHKDLAWDERHSYIYNRTELSDSSYHNDEKLENVTGRKKIYNIYNRAHDALTSEALNECARVSQVINEYKEKFERFLSPLLVLRVAQVTLYLCTLLYAATEKFDMVTVEYLAAVALDIFIYCYFGNQIILQADRVSTAAYQCSWHTMGPQPRRLLLNILLSHRRPVVVRAGRFLPMDLHTFVVIIKTSFSYYTLLVNVNEKKK